MYFVYQQDGIIDGRKRLKRVYIKATEWDAYIRENKVPMSTLCPIQSPLSWFPVGNLYYHTLRIYYKSWTVHWGLYREKEPDREHLWFWLKVKTQITCFVSRITYWICHMKKNISGCNYVLRIFFKVLWIMALLITFNKVSSRWL